MATGGEEAIAAVAGASGQHEAGNARCRRGARLKECHEQDPRIVLAAIVRTPRAYLFASCSDFGHPKFKQPAAIGQVLLAPVLQWRGPKGGEAPAFAGTARQNRRNGRRLGRAVTPASAPGSSTSILKAFISSAPTAPSTTRWSPDSVQVTSVATSILSPMTTGALLPRADRQDGGVRRIDDRLEALDAVHAEVGDRCGAALILVRRQPRLRARSARSCISLEISDSDLSSAWRMIGVNRPPSMATATPTSEYLWRSVPRLRPRHVGGRHLLPAPAPAP